jgi:plastocyanin
MVGTLAIGRVLGQGGFGITYLARDVYLGTWWAVKEFFPDHLVRRDSHGTTVRPKKSGEEATNYATGLTQFLAEAQRLAQLKHPHVVEVKSYLPAHETAYLIMPFYAGETVEAIQQARVRRTGSRGAHQVWSLEEVVGFARPLISAVQYLHGRNPPLLHRDIKPGNLLLAEDAAGPRLLLLDFGAAREAVDRSHVTKIFTPGFAPPEQQIDGAGQTPATDGYAVAAVLYWLLTNVVPSDARRRMLGDDPRTTGLVPPSALGVELPAALESALVAGLALRASDRPPLANLLQALEQAVTRPVPPPPRPPVTPPPGATVVNRTVTPNGRTNVRISSLLDRYRIGIFSALFALALLSAIAGTGTEQSSRVETATEAAAPAAEVTPARDPTAAGAIAASPITGWTHTVNMVGDERGYRFEPAEITVKAGDGIKFVNVNGGPHNVAFDPATTGASAAQITANMPDSMDDLMGKMLVTDGEAWTMSFGGVAPGTYTVFCTPHQAMNMMMKIVVQ